MWWMSVAVGVQQADGAPASLRFLHADAGLHGLQRSMMHYFNLVIKRMTKMLFINQANINKVGPLAIDFAVTARFCECRIDEQ